MTAPPPPAAAPAAAPDAAPDAAADAAAALEREADALFPPSKPFEWRPFLRQQLLQFALMAVGALYYRVYVVPRLLAEQAAAAAAAAEADASDSDAAEPIDHGEYEF